MRQVNRSHLLELENFDGAAGIGLTNQIDDAVLQATVGFGEKIRKFEGADDHLCARGAEKLHFLGGSAGDGDHVRYLNVNAAAVEDLFYGQSDIIEEGSLARFAVE